MLRLGLTGGIGAGKSTVARALADAGAIIIDSDRIAREVVDPGTPGLAALVETFGDAILAADGSLDRAALAARAFGDDNARQQLNGIIHPLVGARTAELIAAAPADALVVQDIPLLVEIGLAPLFHLVAIVDAPVPTRLERLEKRGLTRADAAARIKAQATTEQRRAVADVWWDNSGAEDDLRAQVQATVAARVEPFRANIAAGIAATEPARAADVPRLTKRLEFLAEGAVTAVDGEFAVTAADGVADRLAAGGFAALSPTLHGSSDPQRPALVRIG